ncbi:hypothetical protein E4U47_004108 [Claviceps purpurea]|nr:hypothetical protein E4U47_004108 [Claviceps purpurea]
MASIRAHTHDSITIPLPGSEQSSYSVKYSYCSSPSSATSSDLSGANELSRTHDAPPSYFLGSAVSSSQPSTEELNSRDASAHSPSSYDTRNGRDMDRVEQESPAPAIAYFPPSPRASRLSVNTYDSRFSMDSPDGPFVGEHEEPVGDNEEPEVRRRLTAEDCAIPDVLRTYHGVEPTDPPLRPSDARTFRYLFPSWDCLSIRHDDTTLDGNMNLRVDTVVLGLAGSSGESDRPVTVQLFHLRMHDLVTRHFSLRRYSRDSGREVCFSKREYTSACSTPPQYGVLRSVSSALRHVRAPFQRSRATSSSCFSSKSSPLSPWRPSTTTSAVTGTSSASSSSGRTTDSEGRPARLPVRCPPAVLEPTDKIKLEFGNYARIEVARRNPNCYRFEWWGRTYVWKRVVNTQLNTFSFHLKRDGRREELAHIQQERQSPSQVDAEKRAGGWVPPCYMWFQWSVITGPRDVAEIFIATGLVALVDDCIRREWQSTSSSANKRDRPNAAPSVEKAKTHFGSDSSEAEPSSLRGLFSRRHEQTPARPFRFSRAMSVHY